MEEIIRKLELYLLNTTDFRYKELIRSYFKLFFESYDKLGKEDYLGKETPEETFSSNLCFQHVDDRYFPTCFLIKPLASKARRMGKFIPITSDIVPHIILNVCESRKKTPTANSPIILMSYFNDYICLDGNHRLQSAFEQGNQAYGYVLKWEMTNSSDFFSKYDYYNFLLVWTYPLVECFCQQIYSEGIEAAFQSLLSDIKRKLTD